MIQGFRPPRRLACAALTAAALASLAPAHALALSPFPGAAAPAAPAPRAWGPRPAAPDAAPQAAPQAPRDGLAGSAAGAGRPRPGRPVTEPANPEMLVASRPLPVRPRADRPERPEPPARPPLAPTPPAVVNALGTGTNDRAADLAAHILPLGTGFALMGVGLGYLGMRLRKGL
ncbi:hypothetical protein AB0D66_02200 [Streptomyces sp. NPDC048270]|uniref:hypothetical protein n=1 Tax=Streptomyces sp. NPDC048270 TaxID=3154615 RepID=UPI0033FE59E7